MTSKQVRHLKENQMNTSYVQQNTIFVSIKILLCKMLNSSTLNLASDTQQQSLQLSAPAITTVIVFNTNTNKNL